MPRFIVKPVATEDFYVVWSTVVDAPAACGSREELARELGPEEGRSERFQRADEFGTSMQDPAIPRDRQWFGWHDKAFMLREWPIPDPRYGEGFYEVSRENVRALCEQGEAADPTELLTFTPHEEEELAESPDPDSFPRATLHPPRHASPAEVREVWIEPKPGPGEWDGPFEGPA